MAEREARRPGGLFIQLLDWMLTPLVVLWPAAVIVSYLVATELADASFDEELRALLHSVAEEAQRAPGASPGTEAYPALKALRAAPGNRFLVQVADGHGRVLAGDADMPPLREQDKAAGVVIREAMVGGGRARIASQWTPAANGEPGRAAQVGQLLALRRSIASGVTNVVIVVMIVLVPLMVGMVWFGLYRGLMPLRLLSERIRLREADDLSPIPPEQVPDELAPLLVSLNGQFGRVQGILQAQQRFVGDAAHQLRTPLAGLKSQAQVAIREWPAPSVRQRLARIEESAVRMEHLVTQLLTLARADDARNSGGSFEPVDLDALLREGCSHWADAALAKRSTLAFDAAEGGAVVPGVPILLRELFANLVDNAIRYSPPGSEVAIRVLGGPAPTVLVEDNGPGIPPAERALVFERFYRVLGAGADGSGLGLSIVLQVAQMHGAGVRIEDRPGGGARLVVAFGPPGKP